MKSLLAMVVFVMFLVPPALGDEVNDLLKLTRQKVKVVIGLLDDKKLDKGARNHKILAEIKPIFDFEIMAKLSLGKKYWSPMNKAQQTEFIDLFVERLQESYLEKLDLYTDERVEVRTAKRVRKRIYVITDLISKDDKKEMIYKFYKSRSGWKVYDVEMLGVSVVQTYRSQFGGLLKKGTMADLLKRMRTSGSFKLEAKK